MTKYGTKDWFEKKFTDTTGDGDKWGHSYRISQKIRIEKSFNLIKTEVGLGKNKILDIGCANCDFTKLLNTSSSKNSIHGCDISEKAISINKKHYPDFNFYVISLPDLIFEDNEFNIITALEVINYLNDIEREKALIEIKRCLKKNGIFLFSGVINSGNKYFNEFKIKKLIEKYFKVEKVEYNNTLIYQFFEFSLVGIVYLKKAYTSNINNIDSLTSNIFVRQVLKNMFIIIFLKVVLFFIYKPAKFLLKNRNIYLFCDFISRKVFPNKSKKQIFIVAKNE